MLPQAYQTGRHCSLQGRPPSTSTSLLSLQTVVASFSMQGSPSPSRVPCSSPTISSPARVACRDLWGRRRPCLWIWHLLKPGLNGSQGHYGKPGEVALGAIFFNSPPLSCVMHWGVAKQQCTYQMDRLHQGQTFSHGVHAVTGLPSALAFLRLNPHLSPVAVDEMCQGSSWRHEGGGRKCIQFSGQRAHYILGTQIHVHPTALLRSALNPSF